MTQLRHVHYLAREGVPAICWFSDWVEAEALISYAAFNLDEEARRLAAQVVEILNGNNPPEMPFFPETHFLLVANLQVSEGAWPENAARPASQGFRFGRKFAILHA
jgi:ABC-type uncharacterized transport system substrate-binding protein